MHNSFWVLYIPHFNFSTILWGVLLYLTQEWNHDGHTATKYQIGFEPLAPYYTVFLGKKRGGDSDDF